MPENTSYNVDSGNESEQITRLFEVGVIVLKFDPIANTRFEKRPSGYVYPSISYPCLSVSPRFPALLRSQR